MTVLVALGASLGGLDALSIVLGRLPEQIPMAFVVVQHRHRDGGSQLEAILARRCQLPVVQAEDRMQIEAGRIHVSPPNYHMLIDGDKLGLTLEHPVHCARPSIDVLFESACDGTPWPLIAILLTAASVDGAAGIQAVKGMGGTVIVQDPEEARSPIAVLAALEKTKVDYILKLAEIGPMLMSKVGSARNAHQVVTSRQTG